MSVFYGFYLYILLAYLFALRTIKANKANKLILNSSLAFNPYVHEIARKSWILTKSESGKVKSSI